MDSDTFKIALTAFISNLGLMVDKGCFDLSNDEKNNRNSFFETSALFSETVCDFLPDDLKKSDGNVGQSIKELLSGIQNPENEFHYILNISWHTAIGLLTADSKDNEFPEKLADKERLYPIFEKISLNSGDDGEKKDSDTTYKYRYPPKSVSPETIFPEKAISDFENGGGCLSAFFEEFKDKIKRLNHRQDSSIWIEHFDSLMMRYMSQVPSFLPGEAHSDISIYDHSKVASAVAASLYLFHTDVKENLTHESISDTRREKFLIVSGDFYGIQNFILK